MKKTLTIAPLSTPETITLAAWKAIQEAPTLYVQTANHPSARPVLEAGLSFISMDDLYAGAVDYDQLNESIANRLTSGDSAVYAVMGGGCFAQLPCIRNACDRKGFELVQLSAVPYHLAAFPEAGEGQMYTANELPDTLDTDAPLYISELDNSLLAGEVKLKLQRFYPDDYPVTLAVQRSSGVYEQRAVPLYVLDRQEGFFASTVLYVPALPFEQKQTYGYEDLLKVLRRLRAPDGCPWDREQTHVSLKKDMREECYELMDAIDEDDDEHMIEECGDVLMNILFHPIIGEEQGRFDERDVTTGIVKKLIYRHPHVFGTGHVSSSDEVLKNWDALKQKEKRQQTVSATLKSVPRSFPALLRAEKVQKKARKVGFDFDTAEDAFYKIGEESEELRSAMRSGRDIEKEMGDLLFAAMNVCRLLGLDGEETLHKATDKFIRRFEQMEKNIDAAGKKLTDMTLPEMDAYWEMAKTTELQ